MIAAFHRSIENELLRTSSAVKAIREYVREEGKTDNTGNTFKNVTTELKKRIANLEVRKEKLEGIIKDETRVPELRKTGDLLAANIYKLGKGMELISSPICSWAQKMCASSCVNPRTRIRPWRTPLFS